MNEKEAIEWLREDKALYETDTSHAGDDTPDGKLMQALDMAILALEKRTPQRPYCEGDGYADGVLVYDTWVCPSCEVRYELDYDEYDYCPNCGQAIDWSEQEAQE